MEEQEKKQKPEFKGNLGFIWLVGILVIVLGCTIGYVCKLKKEVKELKQIPPEPQQVAQEQKAEEQTTNENKSEETTKIEEVDKNELEVYGLDTKFKELSKAAIKTDKPWKEKNGKYIDKKINIEYDLDGDGKKEKITGTENKISVNGKAFYNGDVESRCNNIYVVDTDKKDKSKEVVIEEESGTGAGEWIHFYVYKMNSGKLKEITYKLLNEGDIAIDKFYLDGNGKFIVLDEIQENLSPLFALEYFEIENNKINKNKVDISKLSNKSFIISKSNEKYNVSYYMFESKEEAKKHRFENSTGNGSLKKYMINEDTKINIISYNDGVMKVKLSNGNIRYIYSNQRLYWG